MSKTKWFTVRKPSTGEIIATSANQIVPPKFRLRYKNVALYSPDPPFLLEVLKGGLGTRLYTAMHDELFCLALKCVIWYYL